MRHQASAILASNGADKTSLDKSFKLTLAKKDISGVEIATLKNRPPKQSFKINFNTKNGKNYLQLYYPIEGKPNTFLVLNHEIDRTDNLLIKILQDIFFINLFMLFVVIFFAFFLSKIILVPIKTLGKNLAQMNEKNLSLIDTKDSYEEFIPLANSLNRLIHRVQTFIKYQTELFVGIAHELKTPLAVMKTKNEVTLIKQRSDEYYKEAIYKNIDSINEMNNMISAILEIGRQEGAQLEQPSVVDLVTFIKEKANNFQIIAQNSKKHLFLDIRPTAYLASTQPTLILHILQNFVQNAIKFSPIGETIIIRTNGNAEGFKIEIIDNGCGFKDDIDIFAPFKRMGNESGVGLGLFLAKGAAQALNATISVKNRFDAKGVIATLFIPRGQFIETA